MPRENGKKIERLTMTVGKAGEALGTSRANAYALVNSGGIPAIRVGTRRWVVPVAALVRMLESKERKEA